MRKDARNPRYPGLTPCTIGLDFATLVAQKDDLIHEYRKKKYENLIGDAILVQQGHVQLVDGHTVEVDGKHLTGDKVLIATGSRPVVPDIEGLDPATRSTGFGTCAWNPAARIRARSVGAVIDDQDAQIIEPRYARHE